MIAIIMAAREKKIWCGEYVECLALHDLFRGFR